MVIERLLFKVSPPEFSKDFLQADSDVWNSWLQRQPGFITKTSRVLPKGEVEVLVHWTSQSALDRASSKKEEHKFVDQLLRSRSPGTYHLIQSSTLK